MRAATTCRMAVRLRPEATLVNPLRMASSETVMAAKTGSCARTVETGDSGGRLGVGAAVSVAGGLLVRVGRVAVGDAVAASVALGGPVGVLGTDGVRVCAIDVVCELVREIV